MIAPGTSRRFRRILPLALVAAFVAGWAALESHRAAGGHHSALAILGPARLAGVGLSTLAAATLVAMGPCMMQMGLVLTAIWCGRPPSALASQPAAERLRIALSKALSFAAGYLLVFGAAAGALIVGGLALRPYDWVLRAGAGIVLAAAGWRGLAARVDGPGCGGPGSFVSRRRDSPVALGMAYAVYCASCCGPYLAAGGLLAAAGGTNAAAVAILFVLAMAVPVLLPVIAAPLALGLARREAARRSLAVAANRAIAVLGGYLILDVAVARLS